MDTDKPVILRIKRKRDEEPLDALGTCRLTRVS